MAKKPKIIVREIPSKMKVTEIAEEPAPEEVSEEHIEETNKEPSLESITADAPSAREFPEVTREQQPEQAPRAEEPAIPTPAGTTEAEGRAAVRYDVQRNVTEKEIRKVYQSREAETRTLERNPNLTIPERQDRRDMFSNRELEAFRADEQEQNKYEISTEPKATSEKRKYPWEM